MSDETGRGRGATTTIEEIREILADTAREGRRIQREAEKRQAKNEAAIERMRAENDRRHEENEAAAKKQRAENEAAAKKRRADFEKWRAKNEAEAKKRRADFEKWRAKTEDATEKWRAECEERVRYLDSIFTTNWGALIESLVAGDLVKLLGEYHIDVIDIHPNCKRVFNGRMYEIDLVAINGEDVVVVEVKTTLRPWAVDKFLGVLPLFRRIFPEHARKRVLGGVAYLQAKDESDIYAQECGLFVIRATGSSASIINPEGFEAREF